MGKFIDLENQYFGDWHVLKYLGKGRWECECSCGNIKSVLSSELRKGATKSCGCKRVDNLVGKHFGEWEVLEYDGDKYWKCKCSCGKIKSILGHSLKIGDSKSCGHWNKPKDMMGEKIGEWEVIEDKGHGDWLCRCSCGKEKIISGRQLRAGETKSCGHNTNAFKNLKGQHFGDLEAIKYLGNHLWLCKCSCGKEKVYHRWQLIKGFVMSCGCNKTYYRNKKMLEKYNDLAALRKDNPREQWQIDLFQDTAYKIFIENSNTMTINEIANILGLTHSAVLQKVHKLSLESYIDWNLNQSKYEDELTNYIKTIYKGEIVENSTSIITPYELDIYIPDKKLAIEFNGSYWHSTEYKDKYYHQQKTIACAKKGIKLIHIFEYEWLNTETKEKLKNIINRELTEKTIESNNINVQYMNVNEVNKLVKEKLIINTKINKDDTYGIACYDRENIVGALIFKNIKHREYELIAYYIKEGYNITCKMKEMLKRFTAENGIKRIESNVDISKFTGNNLIELNFQVSKQSISEPEFRLVEIHNKNVLNKGEMLEDFKNGSSKYIKIYDSGKLNLEWKAGN